eukprot:6440969-Prymnesium_polylepis.1
MRAARRCSRGGLPEAPLRVDAAAGRCMLDAYDHVWDYCDVGPPSKTPCAHPHPLVEHNHTELQLGVWRDDAVYEHRYNYYKLAVPPTCTGVQIVAVPRRGDPDLYLSFDEPFPTGHSYAYVQTDAAVDVFRI